jgi:oligopeptide/dipeptide ABC transporter ATP-binding protein
MSAVPVPDPDIERKRTILEGDIPNPKNPPTGCNFNTRCPIAKECCFVEDPEYREIKANHWVACHYAEETTS